MKKAPVLSVLLLLLSLALVASVSAPAGNPVYTLTVSPGVPVSKGATVTLSLSIANAQQNSAYSVSISVAKPNGTGQASTSRVISTDNTGRGTIVVPYPDSSFTPTNGTVATDVAGTYTVSVEQTAPSLIPAVATGQFSVASQLTVVLSQPTTGMYFQRGQKVTITATVSDLSGPTTTATVSATTPSGGTVYFPETGIGVYSAEYQVLMYDPVGPWTIQVGAVDTRGNAGLSNTAVVTVTKSDLVVDSLSTYDSKGIPSTDFSPGDTIFSFFRIRYSTGTFLTSGVYRVTIENPSGVGLANLTAVYDTARFGFSTPTGYPVSIYDPAGSWIVAIDAGSANDGFGNTGPLFTTSVRVQIVTATSPWSYLPFVIGSLMAVLTGALVLKKYNTSVTGFEHLEDLMGGAFPRASSVLLLGDPGSGKSVLSYQLLYDELESGRHCALLSYDAFPEDVQGRMREFGWDITSHLRKGRLRIIDCYSGLAGEGEGAIKDPSDLTELNIQVTSIITKAKGGPVTLVLDSLTPIFNGVDSKQAIMFLQTVAAKIKKTKGIFCMTGSTGAISSDSLAKLRSMVDGLIELSLVRNHRRITRYLTVVKMERRRISSEAVPFEIDRKGGIVFRVSRFRGILSRSPRTELETGPRRVESRIDVPRVGRRVGVQRVETRRGAHMAESKSEASEAGLEEALKRHLRFLGRLRATSDDLWNKLWNKLRNVAPPGLDSGTTPVGASSPGPKTTSKTHRVTGASNAPQPPAADAGVLGSEDKNEPAGQTKPDHD